MTKSNMGCPGLLTSTKPGSSGIPTDCPDRLSRPTVPTDCPDRNEPYRIAMLYPAQSLLVTLLLALTLWLGGMPGATAHPHADLQAHSPASFQTDTAPTAVTQIASGGSSVFSFSGKRPTNLGVKDGKLAACPNSPNCVNSQSPAADEKHFIEPLPLKTSPEEAIAQLKTLIEGMDRTQIITASDDYLYAEFTSALMGFVDDVEFYADPAAEVIHVRSASRLGESDLGVNRKRVEAIRAAFTQA